MKGKNEVLLDNQKTLVGKFEAYLTQIEALNDQLKQANELREELEKQIKKRDTRITDLSDSLKEEKAQNQTFARERDDLISYNESIKDELVKAEKNLAQHKQIQENVLKMVESNKRTTQDTITEMYKQRDQARLDQAGFQKNYEVIQAQVTDLEQRLKTKDEQIG